jgi:stage II sporulation protein R
MIGDFCMKKLFGIIIVIICIVLLVPKDEEVRIRVIANSNSSYDQKFKLKIASDLKEFLKTSKDVNIIESHLEYLISKYNADCTVNVKYEKQRFGAKYVGDEVIPGGVYKTLVIELGEAKGKNYWSVIYPEYFNISFEDLNSGDVEYGWWLTELFEGD